jgi:hypothetical protein
VREASAEGLGELVGLTSEEGLKPFVVTITGPLIRIIGDKCVAACLCDRRGALDPRRRDLPCKWCLCLHLLRPGPPLPPSFF